MWIGFRREGYGSCALSFSLNLDLIKILNKMASTRGGRIQDLVSGIVSIVDPEEELLKANQWHKRKPGQHCVKKEGREILLERSLGSVVPEGSNKRKTF